MLSTVLLYRATSDSRAVIAVTEPGAVAVAVVTRGGHSTIPIVHVAFSVSSDPVRSASESIYIRIHVYRYIYIYISGDISLSPHAHSASSPFLGRALAIFARIPRSVSTQRPTKHFQTHPSSQPLLLYPPTSPHQRTRRKNIHTLQTCTQQDSRHRREWPSPIFLWP